MTKKSVDTATAWFGALCFFLSAVEYMIPKPLPFLRLGLANLPIMLAVEVLPLPAFLALTAVKVLGQGLIGGTLFSYIFVFSAAGSLSSALVMWGLKKALRRHVSWIGVGVAGAFASNAAQLGLAGVWIFGQSAWYIAPPFVAVGVVTGALLGAFANAYAARSAWYAEIRAGTFAPPDPAPDSAFDPGRIRSERALRAAVGGLLLLTLLFIPPLWAKALTALAGVALVISDGKRIHWVPTVVMGAGIVFFNLFTPFGRVLASPLGLPITGGALRSGIEKALAVEGMLFISRWMLRYGLNLPGRTGALVSSAFAALDRLTAERGRFNPRDPVASLDDLMYGRGKGPR